MLTTYIIAILAAIIIGLVLIFFFQYRITVQDYEEYFPIRQAEPVFVERRRDDNIVLMWDEAVEPERIVLKDAPDSTTAIETWEPENEKRRIEIEISGKKFRPFFHVNLADNRDLVVSTRIQPFEHIRNFRDMGGYMTESGQQIAWGRLYRSGQMGKPTQSDLQLLNTLGIKTIIDLRDDYEIGRLPDNIPSPVQYERAFITDSVMVRRASILVRRQRLGSEFSEAYKSMIVEEGAEGIGKVIGLISNPDNLPAVIHCTAGKDRAGVVTALILLSLGVPDEAVIADYTLSNHFAEQLILDIERRIRRVRWLGIRKEHFFPIAAAQPKVIENTLAYIREKYGSAESFLTSRAGATEEQLRSLRQNMLMQ